MICFILPPTVPINNKKLLDVDVLKLRNIDDDKLSLCG